MLKIDQLWVFSVFSVQCSARFSPENLIVYLSKCHMACISHLEGSGTLNFFFVEKNLSFLACSRWKIRKIDDFRWFLVFWSKSHILYIFQSKIYYRSIAFYDRSIAFYCRYCVLRTLKTAITWGSLGNGVRKNGDGTETGRSRSRHKNVSTTVYSVSYTHLTLPTILRV